MSDEPKTTDDVEELRQLPREVVPDATLEERIVGALRGRSLLQSRLPERKVTSVGWFVAASVAAMIFGAGFAAGRVGNGSTAAEPSFALMLYGGSTGRDAADHDQRADEYRRWARAEHEWGRVLGGEALGDRVSALSLVDTSVVSESGSDDLVGFFLIAAPDRQAAARLAADCPHLKYGGRVVVREIQPT